MTPQPTFAVIITTYKRPGVIGRSIDSVLTQTYTNWKLFVVIDDPESNYPNSLKPYEGHPQVTQHYNQKNSGKNASLNTILALLAAERFNGYVVYLDDDDWLSETCLQDFAEAITRVNHPTWLVSRRSQASTGTSFTQVRKTKTTYSYPRDVLLTRVFTGDTTHCINFVQTSHCQYPKTIKNAEEWLYFAQVSKVSNFYYLPITGTRSDGYNPNGLTRNRYNNFKLYLTLWSLVFHYRLFSPYVLLYMGGRFIKMILPKA